MSRENTVPGSKRKSVKNDPKIDGMVLKIKRSYQKIAPAAAKQTLAIAPITNNTKNNNKEQLYDYADYEDVVSRKGGFSWEKIGEHYIPYIIRTINGEKLKFVSTRMAETQLFKKYLNCLNTDIFTCTSVRSHFITDSEAGLLNEINQYHTDFFFGNEIFFGGKDYIIRLEDIHDFYTFLEVCYSIQHNYKTNTDREKKCGFIRFNSKCVIPYCIKDNQKYLPLFYFKGQTKNLKHRAIKLENWNVAYLKFCCKVRGIGNEYFANDSCIVISIDEIKNYYSKDTHFEEYWPPMIKDTWLLRNRNSTNVNPPVAWFRKPPKVVNAGNTIPRTLGPLAPVIPNSMPVMMNTYQNGRLANEMSSAMSQGRSLKTSVDHVVPLPPFVWSFRRNTAPVMGQCMTTVNSTMANSNMMSHSNQMQQLYSQCAINNSQDQQLQFQQQHIQQQHQKQPQQITTQSQQSYSGHSEHSRLTNNKLHNPLRNVGSIVITPATEIIDLSSPPSSPVPPTVQETSLRPIFQLNSTRIPEQKGENNRNATAYKVNNV